MAGRYAGRRRLYRSRDGVFLGVCKGIAEWGDFPVEMVRIGFVVLCVFAGLPLWVYFILALILPVEPEAFDGRHHERSRRADDVNAEFEDLKERVRKMEDEEFDKERDWEDRFRKGR